MTLYWVILKDNEHKRFEITGPTPDDTAVTDLAAELRRKDRDVQALATDTRTGARSDIVQEFAQLGYTEHPGLIDEWTRSA
jgi:hypothetical protein